MHGKDPVSSVAHPTTETDEPKESKNEQGGYRCPTSFRGRVWMEESGQTLSIAYGLCTTNDDVSKFRPNASDGWESFGLVQALSSC